MKKIVDELPLILIDHVDYTYSSGTEALKDVNLNVNKGEIIGLLGENGAGKTTLIRTLNGLIRPSSGNIFINGENIKSKSIATLSKNVGIIFQNPEHQLFSNTLEEEIKFSLKSLDLNKKEIELRTEETIKKFSFEKYRNRSPMNLSGGEKKKLAIASIICRDPDIIVFDEPTTGQDAKEIKFFIKLLQKEIEEGKTIIIVTHDVEFAVDHIPRTILMSGGELIADGPAHQVLMNEFLNMKASLLLPQIHQLNLSLKNLGLTGPKDLVLKSDMTIFLMDLFRNKGNTREELN